MHFGFFCVLSSLQVPFAGMLTTFLQLGWGEGVGVVNYIEVQAIAGASYVI